MTSSQKKKKKKEKIPRTGPEKDLDEMDKKPDKTCGEEPDRTAKTKDQLGGQHMFHTTKYGSEELLGMKTKVSTVKGTTGGRVQTVEALADSGASASIISWDLAKKLNIVVFEKGDATLKDASNKHIDVSGKGEFMVQEEYG